MNSKEAEQKHFDSSLTCRFWTTDEDEIQRKIDARITSLLANYSHIKPEDVKGHVLRLREKAFKIFPYACVGQLRFLNLGLNQQPQYEILKQKLLSDRECTLLDIGCCFGQDLRQLVSEGVRSEQLYGVDIDPRFFELGHELFLDQESFKGKFVELDVVHSSDESLGSLKGCIDIVYASSFFHLFNWDDQVKAAVHVARMLKPKPGSVVLGRQMGTIDPKHYDIAGDGRWQYRHDIESMKCLWEEVGKHTDSQWRVEATLDNEEFSYEQNKSWADVNIRRLLYSVSRQ